MFPYPDFISKWRTARLASVKLWKTSQTNVSNISIISGRFSEKESTLEPAATEASDGPFAAVQFRNADPTLLADRFDPECRFGGVLIAGGPADVHRGFRTVAPPRFEILPHLHFLVVSTGHEFPFSSHLKTPCAR